MSEHMDATKATEPLTPEYLAELRSLTEHALGSGLIDRADVLDAERMMNGVESLFADLAASQAREEELRKELGKLIEKWRRAEARLEDGKSSEDRVAYTCVSSCADELETILHGPTVDEPRALWDPAWAKEAGRVAPSTAEPPRDAEWIPDARFDEAPTIVDGPETASREYGPSTSSIAEPGDVDRANAIYQEWLDEAAEPERCPTCGGSEDRDKLDGVEPTCAERWPECYSGGYDPRCCRFPKSCSCTMFDCPDPFHAETHEKNEDVTGDFDKDHAKFEGDAPDWSSS